MSLLKLSKVINTRNKAIKRFQSERWQRGFGCVRCGSIKAYRHRRLKNGLQKYRCEDCGHVFSDQSTTVLKWNKITMEKVAVIAYESTSLHTIATMAEDSELSVPTILRLRKKIRICRGNLYQSMAPPQLRNVVEMDETKIGGRWFWGAIERHGKGIIVEKIANRSEATMSSKIWKYVEEDSLIITDELASYNPHPRFYRHAAVCHSREFVREGTGWVHTNNIESLWKQLKRTINHFCNGIKLEHIPSYIQEYLYTRNYNHSSNAIFFPLCCDQSLSTPPCWL